MSRNNLQLATELFGGGFRVPVDKKHSIHIVNAGLGRKPRGKLLEQRSRLIGMFAQKGVGRPSSQFNAHTFIRSKPLGQSV